MTCVLSLCWHVVGNGRLLCSQIDCCVYNQNQLLHRSNQQKNPCDCGLSPSVRASTPHIVVPLDGEARAQAHAGSLADMRTTIGLYGPYRSSGHAMSVASASWASMLATVPTMARLVK